MVGLSTLPDDLILLVLSYIPNDTLLSLTTVSRALHRCLASQLYRYVYLWESHERHAANHRPPNVPDWRSRYQHLGKPPSYATRIFDSSLFLRTITKSEQLRSYVFGASITCQPDQEEAVFPMIQLLRPSLSYLHLKKSEIDTQTGDLQNSAYKEDSHSYFDLPNIKLLGLSGVRNWNLFTQDSAEKSSTSSITSLCLTSTVPADQGLAKLLSWPKALKSLRYELQLSEISHGFFDLVLSNATALSSKEFGVALRSQERNLEELFIYGAFEGDRSGFEPTETIDLHLFTNLKYVGLPLTFLFISQAEATSRGISVSTTAISKILAPTFEELQIEIPHEYHWSSYFSLDPDDDDVELHPGELSAFIYEIVKNKATRFTGLRSIVFWQPGPGMNPETYTLEGEEGCGEVVETCKAANVHIFWDENHAPPLFGS
ncbi:hypothetical protein G7Y89_g6568 [Cudoniella acicularis]|uniref:F-box domain-containing protein n=1 Tax=Cudoniella acicularis TaxID=354080 RepID=A0A8H4RL20_9HELO|nr:hypothetical protein G7Y89_g6568 [Cudoniella acicularis]